MRRFCYWFLVPLVLLVVLCMGVPPAHAQTPEPTQEPTITPTPAYLQEVTLSSGNTLLIERRVTAGDIAVVIAVLFVALLLVIALFFFVPTVSKHAN